MKQADKPVSQPALPGSERVVAVDTLRGVAVLYSICELQWLTAFESMGDSQIANAFASMFRHSMWHGFTLKDFGLPGFLLIVGVSLTLAMRRHRGTPAANALLLRQLYSRSLLLLIIGFYLTGGFMHQWPNVRIVGVLQRIACCVLVAGSACILLRWRGQLFLVGAIFAAYWIMLAVVPVPGHGAADLSVDGNLVCYVDRMYLPGMKLRGTWDPSGLLGTIPAAALCTAGVVIGEMFCRTSEHTRLTTFSMVGASLILTGLLTSYFVPPNRYLWTPAFVLYSAGIGSLLLGVVWYVTDIMNYRAWTYPFVVVGRNAMFAFAIVPLLPLREFTIRILGGDIGQLFGSGRLLVFTAADLILAWLLLHWMHTRRMYLKI